MQVISVISTKGGEGKSTYSANLAGICADAGLKHYLLMQTVDLNHPKRLISHTCIRNPYRASYQKSSGRRYFKKNTSKRNGRHSEYFSSCWQNKAGLTST